jgi:hypothetical protein
MVRGTTLSLALSVQDSDGNDYTLQTGEVLRFGVKKKPEDADYLFVKEAGHTDTDEDGKYVFTVEPSDTEDKPFGCYYYDVGLQSGENYYNVIEASNFKIAFNVTEWEA